MKRAVMVLVGLAPLFGRSVASAQAAPRAGGAATPSSTTPAPPTSARPSSAPSSPITSATSASGTSRRPSTGPSSPSSGAASGGASDVGEDPDRWYIFVGAHYRGTYLPGFVLSPFVRETRGFYFNTIGAEVDFRKDGFSRVIGLSYKEFGTGNVLFADRTRDLDFPGNWGVANSTLKGAFVTADFLWSSKVHKNVDFEYGLGVGIGLMWGDVITNWVYESPSGAYTSRQGRRYAECRTVNDGTGCGVRDHENSPTARVNRYSEPSWLSGGAKPSILPYISIPQVGVRFKPMKQVQARFGMGLSLTGLWFGLSADYGLEQTKKE